MAQAGYGGANMAGDHPSPRSAVQSGTTVEDFPEMGSRHDQDHVESWSLTGSQCSS